jgi:hypothetical protein
MKQMFSGLAATFLVLCLVLFSMTLATRPSAASLARASSVAPYAQNQPASQWECQTMVAKSPEALAALANQGAAHSWELVSAVHVLNTNRYQWVGFFKRLKQ